MMGSPEGEEGRSDEETQHRVTLTQGFWMAKTEVTQEQWKSVMGNNPSAFKGDNLPVESVNWYKVKKFCRKTGLRLPTEAEWEYACRAGSEGEYGGTGRLEDMGWYYGNSGQKIHPVGQKHANAWGLHDMHGNVWEWCEDWSEAYPRGAVTNPTGPAEETYRVLRGGCWYNSDAVDCRSANREHNGPTFKHDFDGFRPCCSAELP